MSTTPPINLQSIPEKGNYAFIDSQNLNRGVRSQRWKLDFKKFREYLRENFHVTKAFIFIGLVPGNEALYESLTEQDYQMVYKPTLEYEENGKTKVKGNVDSELVLHSMIEYPNYDKAIIVTGDGDFAGLIKYLSEQGKLLKLIIPNQHVFSSLLVPYKESMVYMNALKETLKYPATRRRTSATAVTKPAVVRTNIPKQPNVSVQRQQSNSPNRLRQPAPVKPVLVQNQPGNNGRVSNQRQQSRLPSSNKPKPSQNQPPRKRQGFYRQHRPQQSTQINPVSRQNIMQSSQNQPAHTSSLQQGASVKSLPAQTQQHNNQRRRRKFYPRRPQPPTTSVATPRPVQPPPQPRTESTIFTM